VPDYRELAIRYLAMANEGSDPEISRLLRLLAADYLELAQRPSGQQQQQIQPRDPDEEAPQ
jgi:hypothetical protein